MVRFLISLNSCVCILFILFVINGFVLVAQKYKFDCHFFIVSLFSSWLRIATYSSTWLSGGLGRTLVLPFLSRSVSTTTTYLQQSMEWNGLLLAADVVRPQKSVALKNAAQLQLHRQCVGISTMKKGIKKIFNKNFGLATTFLTKAREQNCWRWQFSSCWIFKKS